jgi:uncharacterized protein (DUF1697 family)
MTVFAGLLRAINVGGTGKLPMAELQALCRSAGFVGVRTYIQSGNALFASPLPEAKVKATLERALRDHLGRPVGAIVRNAGEMTLISQRKPFYGASPNQVLVYFLDEPRQRHVLDGIAMPGREQILGDGREVYVHYPDGIGHSKLKLPFATTATARNLNTIARMVSMMQEIDDSPDANRRNG